MTLVRIRFCRRTLRSIAFGRMAFGRMAFGRMTSAEVHLAGGK